MKSILLHIHQDRGQSGRLRAALDLVRTFDAHLTCVQVTPYEGYIVSDPFGGVYAFPEIIARIRDAEAESRAEVEAALGREGIAWDWLHFDGAPARMLVDRSRLSDLVVMSAPGKEGADRPLDIAADVALHARCPVLALPVEGEEFRCAATAFVAWNGSAEAATALRQARPLLKRAAAVHVVTIGEALSGNALSAAAACRYLSRHGIDSALHDIPARETPVAAQLLEGAAAYGAGFIVMGAYGHSRLRELVLGGVTRDMLGASDTPLVIAH